MSTNSIDQRLTKINRAIPFKELLRRDVDNKESISKYYRLNRLAYRLINSRHGFVHMGISRDGKFKDADFLEHAKVISTYIDNSTTSNIMELAAGKAATTKYLASIHPKVSFTGIDLPNGQLDVSSSQLSNLHLEEGDYNDLSLFEPNTFDLVYIIEALCHAVNKEKVIKEVRRILKPGGVFIIFDGYVSKDQSVASDQENLVSDLIYTSMMVTKGDHTYKALRDNLSSQSFEVIKEEDLSRNVLPTMRRFEKIAAVYFNHPILAKFLNKILPLEVTGNAVAGYLMPLSVTEGLHQYWLTVALKK